jgi:hypothetical protein
MVKLTGPMSPDEEVTLTPGPAKGLVQLTGMSAFVTG